MVTGNRDYNLDDKVLTNIGKIHRGSMEVYVALHKEYVPRLTRRMEHYRKKHGDAAAFAQLVFDDFYADRQKYKGETSLWAYLFKYAREVHEHYPRRVEFSNVERLHPSSWFSLHRPQPPSPFEGLSPVERIVVSLVHFNETEFDDVATILRKRNPIITEADVHRIHDSGMARLRQMYTTSVQFRDAFNMDD